MIFLKIFFSIFFVQIKRIDATYTHRKIVFSLLVYSIYIYLCAKNQQFPIISTDLSKMPFDIYFKVVENNNNPTNLQILQIDVSRTSSISVKLCHYLEIKIKPWHIYCSIFVFIFGSHLI